MKNKKYIPVKLRQYFLKYETLLSLKKQNKITPDQLDELVNLSEYLIGELVNDTVKLRKQSIVTEHNSS